MFLHLWHLLHLVILFTGVGLCRGEVSVMDTPPPPRKVKSEWYASYWNVFCVKGMFTRYEYFSPKFGPKLFIDSGIFTGMNEWLTHWHWNSIVQYKIISNRIQARGLISLRVNTPYGLCFLSPASKNVCHFALCSSFSSASGNPEWI